MHIPGKDGTFRWLRNTQARSGATGNEQVYATLTFQVLHVVIVSGQVHIDTVA